MKSNLKHTRKRGAGAPRGRSATAPTVKAKAGRGAGRRTGGGRTAATARVARGSTTSQQRRDALGLALLAASVFFVFVLYLGWQGGRLGGAAENALTALCGRAALLVPIALAVAGVVAIMRPALPRPAFRWPAATMVLAGTLLALSAGTVGLGAEYPVRHVQFDPEYYRGHGGLLGEALYWSVVRLLGVIGAHVTAIALVFTGLLQLTGVPLVTIYGGARELVMRYRERKQNLLAETAAGRAAGSTRKAAPRVEELLPPEPPGVEPIVRATHVEAPALDEATEKPPASSSDGSVDDDTPKSELAWPEEEATSMSPPQPGSRADAEEAEDEPGVTEADGVLYRLPDPKLLKRSSEKPRGEDSAAQEKVATQLIEALGHFGIESKLVGTVAGPHVTRFELRLAPGTKMSKVAQLKDDLAYALASTDIRILAPIPGKQAVGVEVPNVLRRIVRLGDIYQPLPRDWSPVSVWLGKDIAGKAIGTDVAKMPHLLVAGTTGAGKSGCINTLLCSILLGATPNDVKLVLVDPKQVELNLYESIPHLLTPVVTSPRMAANVLNNLIREMEQRYTLMSAYRVRNITELNERREKEGDERLPYILCVIDELADLMMVAPGEVEDAIIRLAQKSRAVGIHLLLATQRPSADIITGMIKANVPSRIAFAVSSQTDSRVILDQNGAEALLGQGDMLFSPIGSSKLQRIQGAYVTEEEIIELTDFWRAQGEPEFQNELLEATEETEKDERDGMDPDQDDLLPEAISTVVQMGTASTSMLQRRLRVGYTRAGRLIDMMERRGVISGYEGSKARQVLITEADLPRILAMLEGRAEGDPQSPATSAQTLEHPVAQAAPGGGDDSVAV